MEETYKYYTVILLLAATHFAQGFRVMYQKRQALQLLPALMSEEQKLFFKQNVPDEQTIGSLGQTLTLDCEAGGSPSPTIHWLYNGQRIIQGVRPKLSDDEPIYENTRHNDEVETLRLGSTKSRLFIDCLSPKNIGQYTCVAETPYKRISVTTEVSIDYTSVSDDFDDTNCIIKRIGGGTPARIYMWTGQRLEFEGADVQLFCRADGKPSTTIRWEDQRGAEITSDQKQYSVLDNGDLLIRNINWVNNMGVYTCKAVNENGSDEAQVFLYPTFPE